jgi:hypothetical protein
LRLGRAGRDWYLPFPALRSSLFGALRRFAARAADAAGFCTAPQALSQRSADGYIAHLDARESTEMRHSPLHQAS